MDVSRALLLPDLSLPDAVVLKTSALYWEQVVMVDYVERLGDDRVERAFSLREDDLKRLADEGILLVERRAATMPQPSLPAPYDVIPEDRLKASTVRLLATVAAIAEDINRLKELEDSGKGSDSERDRVLDKLTAEAGAMAAELYLNRLHDAFELARDHNLAPLGHSVLSHVGSVLGRADDGAAYREAALLAAAIEGFEISADTPVERICAFRSRHNHLIGRFRSSLVDLSASLHEDLAPTARLAGARDVYRNRVVPALGDLETAMRESRLTFVLRSLVGAAALTLGPVKPVTAAEEGAQLIGRTISYRFSRKRLVQEHPYGYLYKVRKEFGTGNGLLERDLLATAMSDPVEFLRRALGRSDAFELVVPQFWFTQQSMRDAAHRREQELAGGDPA